MRVSAPTKIIIAIFMLIVALCLGIFLWFDHHKMIACERHNEIVDRSNRAYLIVRSDRACDGIASTYDVSISAMAETAKHIPLIEYGDGTSFVKTAAESRPIVKWLNGHTLMIEIGTVAYVRSMPTQAGPLTVEYRIGRIMFKS